MGGLFRPIVASDRLTKGLLKVVGRDAYRAGALV
jgi:hypothetical protein